MLCALQPRAFAADKAAQLAAEEMGSRALLVTEQVRALQPRITPPKSRPNPNGYACMPGLASVPAAWLRVRIADSPTADRPRPTPLAGPGLVLTAACELACRRRQYYDNAASSSPSSIVNSRSASRHRRARLTIATIA